MKFYIDTGVCIGCGLCEEIAPRFFKIGNYHAELLGQPDREEDLALLLDLRRDCPAGAIRIVQEGEETSVYPAAPDHDDKTDTVT